MASIADMCWTSSEDLFEDLDLDALYLRQLKTMGAENCSLYPYMVLVNTGRITIGINLGNGCSRDQWPPGQGRHGVSGEADLYFRYFVEEPPE